MGRSERPADSHVSQFPGNRRRWSGSAQALALAVVLGAEFVLFVWSAGRHLAWIYPRWFDQVQYLRNAYDAFDEASLHGFGAGVAASLAEVSPQGLLHSLYGLVAFEVLGPSRNLALAVNISAFVLLQAVTFAAVRRNSGSWALAWASVGLLAAMRVAWSGEAGSAADYRLDWLSTCLYGAALGTAGLARGFRSTRGAVVFGAAVALVILTRFLSAVYFAVIFAGWLGILLALRRPAARTARLVLSGVLAAGLTSCALWRARHLIYQYYWVGHYSGAERLVRDSHFSLWSSLAWSAQGLLLGHLGGLLLLLTAVAAVALALAGRKSGGPLTRDREGAGDEGTALVPVFLFLGAPLLVLLQHPEKTLATLEIAAVPLVWVFILALGRLGRRAPQALEWVGAAVAVSGLFGFAVVQFGDSVPGSLRDEYRDVNALDDYLYFRSEEAGLVRPRIAVTWMLDSLGAGSFTVAGRERHGKSLRFLEVMPTGIFRTSDQWVWDRLPTCDFVVLVTRATATWPVDQQMLEMLPRTRAWCEANLKRVGMVEEPEFAATVYERPLLARGPEGKRADFDGILAGVRGRPPQARAMPISAPFIPNPGTVLWPLELGVKWPVRAAYSPCRIEGLALPDGLSLDTQAAELTGRFAKPGEFGASLRVTNALGTAVETLRFEVTPSAFEARVEGLARCGAGEPVDLVVRACDASGALDFVDVTDLTAVKVLGRLVVNDGERQSWTGRLRVAFASPGTHLVVVRVVRYHAGDKDPYSFVDRSLSVEVGPPASRQPR